VLADGVRPYYGGYRYSISTGGIYLEGMDSGSDDDMKLYTYIGSKVSANYSPFSRIRFTYTSTFAYDPNGLACVGNILFYSTKKKYIKTLYNVFYAGYQTYTTTEIDISGINEQAFFELKFWSASKAIYGGVNITKIEFLN